MKTIIRNLVRTGALVSLAAVSGCVLAPRGTKEEEAAAREAGRAYVQPFEQRTIPELPERADWRDVLQRAFLANGDLEAAYFEWAAALSRIPQVANYPNSNVAPSFSYMFSSERMKSFDRATLNVGFDPMENLAWPTKVAQAGKVALQEARAAGKRFEAMKFEIQRKVLTAYLDLALHEEQLRIQRDNVNLLRLLMDSASDRVGAGGAPQDLLRAQTQYRLAENQLATMHAEHVAMRSMLNGMLARDPQAQLELPRTLPMPRAVGADDAKLIAVGTENNPELARLAREVAGRQDALELARMAYIPDINPMAGFTGGISQMIGAMVVLPTTIPEIKGKIEESRAMLRSTEAMLRQTRSDRAASFVAALYSMRNAERQAAVFQQGILPRAEQTLASVRQAYAAGTATFTDLIDSQRTLLEVRLMIAEARMEREKRLAELEALAGVDIETLATPTTRPAATHPSEVH
ncbi:MAG TPA: TolC family protein [Tepidisphaeraceae bacterium]|jgi:outer membrane protein TolC|nr:TolC family protein [Tepidisphaeraceae bacterium]